MTNRFFSGQTDYIEQLNALDGETADHIADTTGAHAATAISNTPAGNIAATTVQAAINELDSEKLSASATALPSSFASASINSVTPTGGTLSISGAIQLPSLNTWALTSFGDGKFYISRPGVENYVVVSPTGLAVTGSISATNSTGRIDANDSLAAGVGVGGSLFLRGKDANGDYQDFTGINAFLTDGTVGNVGADLIFKTRLSGTLAERMRLLSYGDLLINQTTNPSGYKLAVTGNVGVTGSISATSLVDISAAGAGQIKFPATQNASADANTLDDYEEGGWTVTATSAAGSITSYTATGAYTKVGRMVSVQARVIVTDAGTGTGALVVSLPFVPSAQRSAGSLAEVVLTGKSGRVYVPGADSNAYCVYYDNTSVIATGADFSIQVTYSI